MAKGYASRTERKDDDDAPAVTLDGVLPPGTCVICKRRPSEDRGLCGTCHAALHGGKGD